MKMGSILGQNMTPKREFWLNVGEFTAKRSSIKQTQNQIIYKEVRSYARESDVLASEYI